MGDMGGCTIKSCSLREEDTYIRREGLFHKSSLLAYLGLTQGGGGGGGGGLNAGTGRAASQGMFFFGIFVLNRISFVG